MRLLNSSKPMPSSSHRLDRDVAHSRIARGTMPVPGARRDCNNITRRGQQASTCDSDQKRVCAMPLRLSLLYLLFYACKAGFFPL